MLRSGKHSLQCEGRRQQFCRYRGVVRIGNEKQVQRVIFHVSANTFHLAWLFEMVQRMHFPCLSTIPIAAPTQRPSRYTSSVSSATAQNTTSPLGRADASVKQRGTPSMEPSPTLVIVDGSKATVAAFQSQQTHLKMAMITRADAHSTVEWSLCCP